MLPRKTVILATALPPDATGLRPSFGQPDLALRFDGPRPNVELDVPKVSQALGCALPPRLVDLLEIAVAVYAADIALPRGENEQWVRSCAFLIPVRDVEFWREAEPTLAEALYVLSHDVFAFEFSPRMGPEEAAPVPIAEGACGDADCVSLLSGGIDSFAGAAMLLATDRHPLFVAHRPHNPAIVASQDHVAECLQRTFHTHVRFLPVRCGPSRATETDEPFPPPEARETSQRTRSFLYMVLGALGCHATGARELHCPENGLLAINPPLTEARVGGSSTAGTRPRTLERFGSLLADIGLRIALLNPFLYQTKGQLIRDVLRQYFASEDIQRTVSCWMAGRMSRPCGTCIPCLVRAIAMRTAGLPPEAHVIDPLSTGGSTGPESAARANLIDLLVFVHRLRTMADAELLHAYPGLLDLPPEASIRAALTMLRRFADEALEAIGGE